MPKQYGFYIDSEKCVGCNTCRVACKDFYDLNLGQNFRRVLEYEGGNWTKQGAGWKPDIFAYYLSIACNHCTEPACVAGCPTGAMHKRKEDGFVLVDQDLCVGCRYCTMRCPYGAPQYDRKNRIMSKCHGCFDRVAEGKLPVCIQACPQRALDFDQIENLRKKYGGSAAIAPLPDPGLTKPNITISGNKSLRPSGDTTGKVQNRKEVL